MTNIRILILLVFLFIIFSIIHYRCNSKSTYQLKTYVVEYGDTAWCIMNNHNYANMDIRELIYYMEKDNNIRAGTLQVGQEIKIRIYGDKVENE